MLIGLRDVRSADRSPCRIGAVSDVALITDLNHPLAGKPLALTTTIVAVHPTADRQPDLRSEPGDDIIARICDQGPGMQGRWQGQPTNFFSDRPFLRLDDGADAAFYERPRLVDHLDRTAIAEISALYGRLVPRRSRVLDLMTSWHSHLPPSVAADAVVGLGMNAEELARNPALTDRVVQDLNADPRLPFDDGCFDAVVCSLSVEYLIRPFEMFRELARVLSPGGIAIMTFSNRCFPAKAIRIWEQLHEFERPGLVLEYFRESGHFHGFNTWSLRGLPRPADDNYAHRLSDSDPVHAVWARRIGELRLRL